MFCLSFHSFCPLFSLFVIKHIHWDFYISYCLFQLQNFHLVFLCIFYFLFLFVWSIFVAALKSLSGHINISVILGLASIFFFIQFECFQFFCIMNYFIETWIFSCEVWDSRPYLILILKTDLIWHLSGSGSGLVWGWGSGEGHHYPAAVRWR